jgi:hypothetical protein
MNQKLKEAEDALRTYLPNHPYGVTLEDILKEFGKQKIKGPELRAAVWALRAAGRAKFDRGRVFPAAHIPAARAA